jgi:hypothetical protein
MARGTDVLAQVLAPGVGVGLGLHPMVSFSPNHPAKVHL